MWEKQVKLPEATVVDFVADRVTAIKIKLGTPGAGL